ncbi:MAG: DUF58 domain-containing protein [Calditrichia bacterium]
MKKQDSLKYLNPESVKSLGSFKLIARAIVEGFLVGLHKSPFHGFSAEFSEYRQYMKGDEPRHIDWKVFARTDRYYIKQFEEETNLHASIVLDRSASMGYSSGPVSKWQYGTFLTGALCYLLYKQRDNFSVSLFSDKIDEITPFRHSLNHLNYIFSLLQSLETAGKTEMQNALHLLAEKLRYRGLVIIISDFMGLDLENIKRALLHFRHGKHEVIVFHILDPMEITLDFEGEVQFVDLETGQKIKTHPSRLKEKLYRTMEAHLMDLHHFCQNHQIDYNRILTSDSFVKALTSFFAKRVGMK